MIVVLRYIFNFLCVQFTVRYCDRMWHWTITEIVKSLIQTLWGIFCCCRTKIVKTLIKYYNKKILYWAGETIFFCSLFGWYIFISCRLSYSKKLLWNIVLQKMNYWMGKESLNSLAFTILLLCYFDDTLLGINLRFFVVVVLFIELFLL